MSSSTSISSGQSLIPPENQRRNLIGEIVKIHASQKNEIERLQQEAEQLRLRIQQLEPATILGQQWAQRATSLEQANIELLNRYNDLYQRYLPFSDSVKQDTQLKNALEETLSNLDKVRALSQQRQKQNEELQDVIRRQQNQMQSLEQEKLNLSTIANQSRAIDKQIIDGASTKNNTLAKANTILQEQLHQLNMTAKAKETNLQKQIDELKHQLDAKLHTTEQYDKTISDLKSLRETQEKKIQELEENLSTAGLRAVEMSTNLQTATDELAQQKLKMETAALTIESLQKRVKKLKKPHPEQSLQKNIPQNLTSSQFTVKSIKRKSPDISDSTTNENTPTSKRLENLKKELKYKINEEFDLLHYDACLKFIKKLLAIDSSDPFALIHQVFSLQKLGNFNEALIKANEILAIDPKHPEAIRCKIECLYTQRDFASIEQIMLTATQENPQDDTTWSTLAHACRLQSKYEEAIGYASQALELNQNNESALKCCIDSYLKTQQYPAAIQCYIKLKKYSEAFTLIAQLKKNTNDNHQLALFRLLESSILGLIQTDANEALT